MNGKALNTVLKMGAMHALYRADGLWYHNLKQFPGILFDDNGYVIFETEEEYINDPLLQHKKDLHIKNGISGHSNYREFDGIQRELLVRLFDHHANEVGEETIRKLREVNLIIRKRALSSRIKTLYNNACQICGIKLQIAKDVYYSEVHHIVSLGKPHDGLDTLSNMLCVCPNHHVLLDLKVFQITVSELKTLKHKISNKSIDFHNNLVQNNHPDSMELNDVAPQTLF